MRLSSDSGQAYNETLKNREDVSYTGTVFFGTPLQGSATDEYIYDTGSGYLTVAGTDCSNCHHKIYNPYASSTYEPSTNQVDQLDYGSCTLEGTMVIDSACLSDTDSATCVSDFNFFMI